MIRIVEVSTFSRIPNFVPFGVLYYTQDTNDIYIGTGASTGPAVTFVAGGAAVGIGALVNAQGSGVSSYTPVLADAGQLITMSSASSSTLTVPANSTTNFVVGTVLTVNQLGAGQITLTPGGGVTISTPSSLTTRAQYSTVAVCQTSTNTWVAGGDLT
jgi:hypothetical protein